MKMCIVIKKNRHQRGYPQEIQPLELSELVDSKITLNNTFRKIKEKMYKWLKVENSNTEIVCIKITDILEIKMRYLK